MQGSNHQIGISAKTDVDQASRALLDKRAIASRLGVSLRTVDQFLADGVLDRGLNLGPRMERWREADYDAMLDRLERRKPAPEPERLVEARHNKRQAVQPMTAAGQRQREETTRRTGGL